MTDETNTNEERSEQRIEQVTCKPSNQTAAEMDFTQAAMLLGPLIREFNATLRGHVPWYAIESMNANLLGTFIRYVNQALGLEDRPCVPGLVGRFAFLFNLGLRRGRSTFHDRDNPTEGWLLEVRLPDEEMLPIMFLPTPSFRQSRLPKSMGSQVGGFIEWEVEIDRTFREIVREAVKELGL